MRCVTKMPSEIMMKKDLIHLDEDPPVREVVQVSGLGFG